MPLQPEWRGGASGVGAQPPCAPFLIGHLGAVPSQTQGHYRPVTTYEVHGQRKVVAAHELFYYGGLVCYMLLLWTTAALKPGGAARPLEFAHPIEDTRGRCSALPQCPVHAPSLGPRTDIKRSHLQPTSSEGQQYIEGNMQQSPRRCDNCIAACAREPATV